MQNMEYCRFENTLLALEECYDDLEKNEFDLKAMMKNANSREARAMKLLIVRVKDIAEEFEDDFFKDLEL